MTTKASHRETYTIDASDMTLGRLATRVATLLRGKDRPSYVPHVDAGGFVHVTNLRRIMISARKMEQRRYRWHTRYPGALKEEALRVRWARDPSRVLRDAVSGMLPSTRLRKAMLKRLKVTE